VAFIECHISKSITIKLELIFFRHISAMRHLLVCVLLFGLIQGVLASNTGVMSLTAFPSAAVADGKSSVSIDAEVRDSNGRLVPDGTRVLFSTDLGSFREPIVATQSGLAHSVLVAGSIAGTAKVTASALSYQTTSTIQFQFVADRSLLSGAKEYVEIVADKDVHYSFEDKIFVASSGKTKVFLRYRDIEIHADELELNLPTYEVKAKRAIVKMGKSEFTCADLYLKLDEHKGFGTTTFKKKLLAAQPDGRFLKFVPGGEEEDTYGIAALSNAGTSDPQTVIAPEYFRFDDVSNTTTDIVGRKVTAFPNKKIQFQAAQVFVGSARVMKVPLYELDLVNQNHVFSDQIFNVNNSTLALNYPYYLSLKPGVTSLLRLRTGQTDGVGLAANRGVFLDYEYNWNKGDDQQGGIGLLGLGRSDWGFRANQYWRSDDGSSMNALLELPSHRSLFGTLNGTKQLKGYNVSMEASAQQAFAGTPFSTDSYSLALERDPMRFGKLPFQFFIGAQAFSTISRTVGLIENPDDNTVLPINQSLTNSQSAVGLRFRGQSQQINFGPTMNLTSSFSVSKLEGHNTLAGLTYLASTSLHRSFGPHANMTLGYDYTEDGYNSALLGRHQLNLSANYNLGHAYVNVYGIKALDTDRFAYQLDTSYRLNKTWRVGYSLTKQGYLGSEFTDASLVLGFRVGYKEFGITYSQINHRLGFQLLGSTFN
jgi:hypothetical protein